jgi:hypothetical protein
MLFEQSLEPSASTGSPQPQTTRSQGQVVNDARVMEYMKTKYVEMKQELKDARNELNRLRTRPGLSTQREDYVLGEMELVNRQLESEYDLCLAYYWRSPFA